MLISVSVLPFCYYSVHVIITVTYYTDACVNQLPYLDRDMVKTVKLVYFFMQIKTCQHG